MATLWTRAAEGVAARDADKRLTSLADVAEEALRFSKEFREQGDAAFYQPHLMKRRKTIRKSLRLQAATLQFWTVCGKKPAECMNKGEFLDLHRRVRRLS